MLQKIVGLTNDATGLEKCLRLFQALCTIASALAVSAAVASTWRQAQSQLALGATHDIHPMRRLFSC